MSAASASSRLIRLAKPLARLALWFLIGLLLFRGIMGIVAPPAPAAEAVTPLGPEMADAERAFAIAFARAYLEAASVPADEAERLLRPYLAEELDPETGLEPAARPIGPDPSDLAIAGVTPVDEQRTLVTVVAVFQRRPAQYLTVPVAGDGDGLSVYDYPSFSPAPARAEIEGEDTSSLPADDRDAIEAVVERFLRDYLAGDAAALDYLAPPRARPGASSLRLRLEDLVSVDQVGEGSPGALTALATVRARERHGTTYTLRYRLSLLRSDRWYVAAVNAPTEPDRTVGP